MRIRKRLKFIKFVATILLMPNYAPTCVRLRDIIF